MREFPGEQRGRLRGAAVCRVELQDVCEYGGVYPRGAGGGRRVEECGCQVRGAGAGSGQPRAAAAGGVDEECWEEAGMMWVGWAVGWWVGVPLVGKGKGEAVLGVGCEF